MNMRLPIELVKENCLKTLKQVESIETLQVLDLPGEFVFSPPDGNRLCVGSISELHEARSVLREKFGWKDSIGNKFFSQGRVIVTYQPDESVELPLPFELWVEAEPAQFPTQLLGDCRIVESPAIPDYSIVCPI